MTVEDTPAGQTADAAWSAVLGAALLGTGRRPWAGVAVSGLPSLPAGADGLLQSAALLTLWREAGRTVAAPPLPSTPSPSPDDRPVMGPEPGRLLTLLLQDRRQTALLDEWLERAAASGLRIPGALLVDLIGAVGTSQPRRRQLRRIGGPLLEWLAAQNPEWAPLVADEVREFELDHEAMAPLQWDEASDEARLATFDRVRAADPIGATDLLARVLPTEPATVAVALVERLADGLSADDADLLETVLDDRRKRVRAAANALLDHLPTSARAARLAALTVPAVTVSGLLRRSLTVTELPSPDDVQERDGVTGKGADQLRIAVGGAALDAWEARLGRPPAELARLALASSEPLAKALVDGWAHAARQQRHAPWVRALLDAGLPPDAGLLAVLEADEADRRFAATVAKADLAAMPTLIAACDAPWGPAASAAAMTTVSRIVSRVDLSNRPDPALTRAALAMQSAIGALALRLHPRTDPTPLIEAVPRAPTPALWVQVVAGSGAGPASGLAGTLAFRAALASAFPTPTPGSSS